MTWQESIEKLTKDNGALKSLRDLLIKTAYQDEALQSTFTPRYNVANGQKLGWVGDMDNVGWKGAVCSPEYKNILPAVAEKTWEIDSWQIPLKYCFTDFENTVAEYALSHNTEVGDLTDDDIWPILIENPLTAALTKMYWRLIWFGDVQAQNLTKGTETTLFTTCDGLWKRLMAVATDNSAQLTEIAANSKETLAEQKSALLESGVAVGIFDKLLMDADPRIAGQADSVIMCTKSLKDALTYDLREKYNYQMTWELVKGGLEIGSYNGVKIMALSVWDRLIMEFFNSGTALYKPHRAVYAPISQLMAGTPGSQIITDVDVFFNRDDRVTKLYSAGWLGTITGEDDLLQIAY